MDQEAHRQRHYSAANKRAVRQRRQLTSSEQRMWRLLQRLDGFHFRKQSALGPYTYDFIDHGHRLLIEVDGGIHAKADVAARDRRKEDWAATQGYRVVRIPNAWVWGSGEAAVLAVLEASRG